MNSTFYELIKLKLIIFLLIKNHEIKKLIFVLTLYYI